MYNCLHSPAAYKFLDCRYSEFPFRLVMYPELKLMITAAQDGTMNVYSTKTPEKRLHQFIGHTQPLTGKINKSSMLRI